MNYIMFKSQYDLVLLIYFYKKIMKNWIFYQQLEKIKYFLASGIVPYFGPNTDGYPVLAQ